MVTFRGYESERQRIYQTFKLGFSLFSRLFKKLKGSFFYSLPRLHRQRLQPVLRGDALRQKTICTVIFEKRAQILNELLKKNLNARAGGRLNFENYWLKNVAIINYIFIFVRFAIFRLGRRYSGVTNRTCSYSIRYSTTVRYLPAFHVTSVRPSPLSLLI